MDDTQITEEYPKDGYALKDTTPAHPSSNADYLGMIAIAFKKLDEKTPEAGINVVNAIRQHMQDLPETAPPQKKQIAEIIKKLPDEGVAELMVTAFKQKGMDLRKILKDGVITQEETLEFLTERGKEALQNERILKEEITPQDRLSAQKMISEFGAVSDDEMVTNLAATNRYINQILPPEIVGMLFQQDVNRTPGPTMPQPDIERRSAPKTLGI